VPLQACNGTALPLYSALTFSNLACSHLLYLRVPCNSICILLPKRYFYNGHGLLSPKKEMNFKFHTNFRIQRFKCPLPLIHLASTQLQITLIVIRKVMWQVVQIFWSTLLRIPTQDQVIVVGSLVTTTHLPIGYKGFTPGLKLSLLEAVAIFVLRLRMREVLRLCRSHMHHHGVACVCEQSPFTHWHNNIIPSEKKKKLRILYDFRFSRWSLRKLRSSEMWHLVFW